jgi:hypothetical protein
LFLSVCCHPRSPCLTGFLSIPCWVLVLSPLPSHLKMQLSIVVFVILCRGRGGEGKYWVSLFGHLGIYCL